DRQGNLRGQDIVRIESRRDILQLDKTFDEQPGADKQDKSESGFGDDEAIAQPVAMETFRRTASAFLQCFGQFRLRANERRHKAEKNSSRNGNHKRHRSEEHTSEL